MNINIPESLNKKSLLEDLLSQCTDKQQKFLSRIFPKGIVETNIDTAIGLCRRTVEKNKRR